MIRNGKLNMYLGKELERALLQLTRDLGENTPEGAIRTVILEAVERRRGGVSRGHSELARADAVDRALLKGRGV